MATKSATPHRNTRSNSRSSARRTARTPVLVERKIKAVSKRTGRDWQSAFMARDKKFAQTFGAAFPKGKLVAADGSYVTPAVASREGVFTAQFAPTPDRMSWLYVTHGLSQSSLGKGGKPAGVELVLHWRERQPEITSGLLSSITNYILESGAAISAGELLTGDRLKGAPQTGFPHWLACPVDKSISEHIDADESKLNLVLLLGITEAEMQYALKVNAQLADGRQVLLEALRIGGIFPVTDALRNCLTRRRDFLRVWESAFHAVRERTVK